VADEQKPISVAEAAAEAANAPAFKDLGAKDGPEAAQGQAQSKLEDGEKKDEKKEGNAPSSEAKDPAAREKEQTEQAEQKQEQLPTDVAAQFPDADFSKTTVIMNSAEAAQRGVDGFAEDGVIHVAPNVADVKKVLRHEATHIVQQAKKAKGEKSDPAAAAGAGAEKAGAEGDKKAQPGGAAGAAPAGAQKEDAGGQDVQAPAAAAPAGAAAAGAPTAQLEKEANAAESGAAPAEISASAGQKTLNRGENMGADNMDASSPQGVPKVTLGFGNGGIVLDSVSGQFEKEIVKAKWDPKKLAEVRMLYRIPAFPVAGVYVAAGATFTPDAKITASASYQWKPADRKFTIAGQLTGSISGALTGYVEGGAALDAVVQRGGVGLRASLTASATAQISRGISFAYSPTGGFEWALTPFDIDINAQLMAALTLRAWTEGWFANKAKEWTFLEFPIASLQAAKLVLEMGGSSRTAAGVAFKSTKPGTLQWGAPPEPTESAGRNIR
jgi:hypothetical protein